MTNTPSNPDGVGAKPVAYVTDNVGVLFAEDAPIRAMLDALPEPPVGRKLLPLYASPKVDRGVSTAEEEAGDRCHPSHVTRISMDASSYDEICVNCGATDHIGGWGALAKPCPRAVAYHEPPLRDTQAGLSLSGEREAVAWLDLRTEDRAWNDGKVVATNPEYVQNNGPENFAPLYRAAISPAREEGVAEAQRFPKTLGRIHEVIDGYVNALVAREHGGVAQDRAFTAICEALGRMPTREMDARRSVLLNQEAGK